MSTQQNSIPNNQTTDTNQCKIVKDNKSVSQDNQKKKTSESIKQYNNSLNQKQLYRAHNIISNQGYQLSFKAVIILTFIFTALIFSLIFVTLYFTVLQKSLSRQNQNSMNLNPTLVRAQSPTSFNGTHNIILTCQVPNIFDQVKIVQNDSATQNGKWIYFDQPKPFGQFIYDTAEQVNIKFDSIIPLSTKAKQMKLISFLRTGSQQNSQFWTRTKVINDGQQTVHFTFGQRYPQQAVSYNSETIVFPIQKTREIRVKSSHIQRTNCHKMQFFIAGYRI